MSDIQVLVLWAMTVIGGLAAFGLALGNKPRLAMVVWIVFCVPGLIHFWLKGVLG